MKPRYTKDQILKAKAAVENTVERGEMVTVLAVTLATKNVPWYRVRSAAGKTAWMSEHSLTPAVGGE